MKNIFRDFVKYFLLILILTGCGNADSISNSTGPSSPSNLFMDVKITPSSIPPGGNANLVITLTFANGVPAAGFEVSAVRSDGGTSGLGSSDANGHVGFVIDGINTAFTINVTVENISVNVRVNVNA